MFIFYMEYEIICIERLCNLKGNDIVKFTGGDRLIKIITLVDNFPNLTES